MNVLMNSQDTSLRQLAAVLLKRNINTHYLCMEENDKKFLKQTILQVYFAETQRPVRRAIGFLIGVLTKSTIPNNDWNELLQCISQKTEASQSTQDRESAITLLGLILDISGEHLVSHFQSFFSFFQNTIQDPDKSIRYESLKCILHLWENGTESEQLALFASLIEPCLKVVNECIDDEKDELVHLAFNVIDDLTVTKSPIFNEKVYTALVLFVCSERVLLNSNLEVATRKVAMIFLVDLIQFHKPVVTKNPELLRTLVN